MENEEENDEEADEEEAADKAQKKEAGAAADAAADSVRSQRPFRILQSPGLAKVLQERCANPSCAKDDAPVTLRADMPENLHAYVMAAQSGNSRNAHLHIWKADGGGQKKSISLKRQKK